MWMMPITIVPCPMPHTVVPSSTPPWTVQHCRRGLVPFAGGKSGKGEADTNE